MQDKDLKVRSSGPGNREVVHGAGDRWVGNLATPINASAFVTTYLNLLPAYRKGLSPLQRGVEVGMAHGYWLVGPFARLGPLRESAIANSVGLLCAIVLIGICTLGLWLYALSNPPVPIASNVPAAFKTSGGWTQFANGFLVGGGGGAIVAWLVLVGVSLLG